MIGPFVHFKMRMISTPARILRLSGKDSDERRESGPFVKGRCGTQNRAVFWPFGKRAMELLILDKKERVAESQ